MRVKEIDMHKFDPKVKKYISFFVDLDDMSYHIWDELMKKVSRSRNITFYEQVEYKYNLTVDSEFTKEQPKKEKVLKILQKKILLEIVKVRRVFMTQFHLLHKLIKRSSRIL